MTVMINESQKRFGVPEREREREKFRIGWSAPDTYPSTSLPLSTTGTIFLSSSESRNEI